MGTYNMPRYWSSTTFDPYIDPMFYILLVPSFFLYPRKLNNGQVTSLAQDYKETNLKSKDAILGSLTLEVMIISMTVVLVTWDVLYGTRCYHSYSGDGGHRGSSALIPNHPVGSRI